MPNKESVDIQEHKQAMVSKPDICSRTFLWRSTNKKQNIINKIDKMLIRKEWLKRVKNIVHLVMKKNIVIINCL